MRVTKVEVSGRIRFTASKGEATGVRHEMVKTLGVKKSADQMEAIEIPTSKTAFLPWINALLAQMEARVRFEDELGETGAGEE
jgi:hypothetical protein